MNLVYRLLTLSLKYKDYFSLFQYRYVSDGLGLRKAKYKNPFKRKYLGKMLWVVNDVPIANRICVTIFGNGAPGQPRCLGLFTEFKAYLFNCGEGVGRLCREYEVNICQIKNVFITQKTWRNVSGLPDIYLSNEVFGVKKMNIYGPPGIDYIPSIVSAHFPEMVIKRKTDKYTDDNIEIDCIPIILNDRTNDFKIPNHQTTENASPVFAYSCKIFAKTGDFLPEKCVELGVPFGSHLLKLKNGEDVVLPSGRVICSEDVTENSTPTTVFLVIDCPTEDFLHAFEQNANISQYQNQSRKSHEVSTVFHFSPAQVIQSTKYQAWMKKFHQDTEHVVLNSCNSSVCSQAVHHMQSILHHLHSEIFKLLPEKEKADSLCLSKSLKIMQPPPMLQLYFRPERKLDWCNVVRSDADSHINTVQNEMPQFWKELENLSSLPDRNKRNTVYPEVLFLGTSSATSTGFRNVSAILLNINSQRSILLDCGEGTLMQMTRYFGPSNIGSVLCKLSCIFVSHKHTDHYLGLFELIKSRIEAFENAGVSYQPLVLILPKRIRDAFRNFCDLFEPLYPKVRIFSCSSLTSDRRSLKMENIKKFLEDVEVETVPVIHCEDAYGIVLNSGSEWKIVYSGDTAPCQKLIDAGKNCDLLIHEASIEDDLASEANFKLHCTPRQVVDIAEKMNASYTVMTHFSKRYLAMPVFGDYGHRNMGFAFDFMKINFNDLHILPTFLPTLKSLFQEQVDSNLERTSSVSQFENFFLKSYRSLRTN